ncbi:hypothetical protein OAV62_00455 [bacterium]|nr:hypothetical protein [bacterium]
MKKTLFSLAFIIAVVVYFFQLGPVSVDSAQQLVKQHGLPWQIELDNGNSRVFGITLGTGTLADAIEVLSPDYELAILAKHKEAGAVEVFYSHFSAGQLQGKLILVVDTNDALLASLKAEAFSANRLDNGTKKYLLSREQFLSVKQLPIRSVTFVPTARLSQDIIEQHFGSTDLTIVVGESVTHYLYPSLGLNVRIDDKGKDLLEYVAPKSFR